MARMAVATYSPASTGVADQPSPAATVARATVLSTTMPRRLAVVITPWEGESFASWVDRFAAAHHIPPGQLATQLGVEVRRGTADVRPVFYGLALTEASRARLIAATGLDAATLDGLQLSRYDGTALDLTGLDLASEASLRTVIKREWLLVHGSCACPRCLEHASVWPTWWRLGIAAVCPTHKVLLVDSCPRCGIGLRRGYKHHPRGLSNAVLADPGLCGNHTERGRCPQPMAAISTTPVDQHLVTVQQTALRAANGEAVTIGGMPVHPAEWFQALKYLAAMIRFSATTVCCPLGDSRVRVWMDEFAREYELRRNKGYVNPGSLRAIPSSAERAAGLLAAAQQVLGAGDRRACTQALAPVAAALTVRCRLRRHNPLRQIPLPKPLAGVLAELIPAPSRVAGLIPTLDAPAGVEVRHVPQQLHVEDYRDLVAAHLPGTAEPTGRRLASLALARALGATSWAHAARLLDMDPRKASRASNTVVQRISDVAEFWDAISHTMQRLGQRELIDFAARRACLADLTEVPAAVLAAGCHPLGLPVTPQRRCHAAASVWAQLTCGDVRDAPAYAARWAARPESVREGARRFAAWLPEPVQAVLRDWASRLLSERGVV